MIELWSKEQLNELVGPHVSTLAGATTIDKDTATNPGLDLDGNKFELVDHLYVPEEKSIMVWKITTARGQGVYVKLSLTYDSQGPKTTIEQVLRRKRMVAVIDYPDLKEYQKDPGTGLFG